MEFIKELEVELSGLRIAWERSVCSGNTATTIANKKAIKALEFEIAELKSAL